MKTKTISFALLCTCWFVSVARGQDALDSWNDTGAKKAMPDFVERVTKRGSPDSVKPEDRVATLLPLVRIPWREPLIA